MNTSTSAKVDFSTFGLEPLRSDEHDPVSPVERLRRLAALEQGDVAVIVVYAIAVGLVSLAVPIAAQSIVNTVAFTALLQPVLVLSILVFLGLITAGILRTLQYKVIETLQQRLFVRMAYDSVRRLTKANIRGFGDGSAAPELMNRFFEVATIQKAASTLLLDGLSVVLQGGVSLLLLAFYHPALLAFDVVLMALIAFMIFGLGRNGVSTAIKESKAKYATAAWLEEMAGALRTFKSRESQEFATMRADELAKAYVLARGKHFKILVRQIVASYILQAIATAGLLGLGGFLVIKGQLTLGQLVAAELIVTAVLVNVAKFGKYLESYYDLVASVDKVGNIVDLPSEREEGASHARVEGPARVELIDVEFSYGSTPALRDISIDIAPGAQLAILGSDASGKSTLVDILYGLRAPSQGQVKFDGIDVRTLALSDLRRDVALVGKAEIFDASVIDNLCLGRPDVDATTIANALECVGLSEEIGNLSEGTLTKLGPSGCRLTTSQAARLTIARGIVAKPRLLIVDEALDRLGTETAIKVLHGIARNADSTTVLVLTSRQEIAEAVGTLRRLDKGTLFSDVRSREVSL
ncbi:MAG: ABC transporter ATP-binding protein [Polyangiaceae bacterium]|nr:ABC transporter ATP-binding protein [Polyangiaceae bacterium]